MPRGGIQRRGSATSDDGGMTDAPVPPATPSQPQSETTPQPNIPLSAQAQVGPSSVGASSTSIMLGIEANRKLIVATMVLVVITIVGLVLSVVMLRGEVAAVSERLDAITAGAAQQPEQPAQEGAQEQPPGITEASEISGVEMPNGASTTGSFLIGNPDAANVVEVFVDMQCPYCQKWHAELGQALEQQALAGDDLLVKVNAISFLGENATNVAEPGASLRAANAAACVLSNDGPTVYADVATAIFAAADPSEPPTQFQTEQLQQLAMNAGASEPAIECIADAPYAAYVVELTKSAFARGVGGTPTVVVNGITVDNPFTAPELLALLQQ